MALIGISGKMQSGKNLTSNIIQYLTSNDCSKQCLPRLRGGLDIQGYHNSEWQQKAFAGKLKQIVSILTGIPVEDLEKQEVKDKMLGEEWDTRFPYENSNIGDGEIQKYTLRLLLQKIGTDAMRDVIHHNIWINALFADYKPIKGYSHKIQYVDVIDNVAQIDLSYKSFIMCQKDNRDINYEDCKLEGNILKVYNTAKIGVRYIDNSLPNWIITDLRFPNELDAIKQRGGITIRVNRPVENYPENPKFNGDMQSAVKIAHNHPSETALDNAEFNYVINNDGSIEDLIEKVKEILIKEQII